MVAERLLYVPSIGYCMLLGLLMDRLSPAQESSQGSAPALPKLTSFAVRIFFVCAAITVIGAFAVRFGLA